MGILCFNLLLLASLGHHELRSVCAGQLLAIDEPDRLASIRRLETFDEHPSSHCSRRFLRRAPSCS